jgi:hypothetical protein
MARRGGGRLVEPLLEHAPDIHLVCFRPTPAGRRKESTIPRVRCGAYLGSHASRSVRSVLSEFNTPMPSTRAAINAPSAVARTLTQLTVALTSRARGCGTNSHGTAAE